MIVAAIYHNTKAKLKTNTQFIVYNYAYILIQIALCINHTKIN